jgi:exonuclease SbcC
MRLLTEDGARHLMLLSQGRYSLLYDGSDFLVADHWNADRERSVKTLSGGETFLAALSLSLALAERIVGMAAQAGGGAALECLFVDEGFGALDAESLEAAVQALETLQGGNRMVGVVTHLQQLAERLPARLCVETDAGKARVVVA